MNSNKTQFLVTEEIEFFAEDELVEIIPNIQLPVVNLVAGDFGPFEVGVPIKVPLWLAISLKEAKRCRIMPPSWLNEEFLSAKVEEERNNPNSGLVGMHLHYLEITSKLLHYAPDDLEQSLQIRRVLEDLMELRTGKLRKGLSSIRERTPFIKLNHISWMELNSLRTPLLQILCMFASFEKPNSTLNRTQMETTTQAPEEERTQFRRTLRYFR
eukprot:jgi/Galph1/3687/GphlegSOOS_G2340.1